MKLVVTLEDGRTMALDATQVTAYSDQGDPVVHAMIEPQSRSIMAGHCGEDGWAAFCDDAGVYRPRDVRIMQG